MSAERKSGGNPNAKAVVWHGTEFPTMIAFKEYLVENDISLSAAMREINDPNNIECYKESSDIVRSEVECEHCGYIGLESPAFKRWHGNNCKSKL